MFGTARVGFSLVNCKAQKAILAQLVQQAPLVQKAIQEPLAQLALKVPLALKVSRDLKVQQERKA